MNKLHGELVLDEVSLQFRFSDFSESDLQMNLPLIEVNSVMCESVYGLNLKALKISSIKGRNNIFILDNPTEFRSLILNACKANLSK